MPSPAAACLQALQDADKAWPGRSKSADGIMGDAAHQARVSDHNEGNAVDITHDPEHGADGEMIASLAISDPRAKYVIWNRRIYNLENPVLKAQGWRIYTGPDAHTGHVHISILASARDDARPWPWADGQKNPVEQASLGEKGWLDGIGRLALIVLGVSVGVGIARRIFS